MPAIGCAGHEPRERIAADGARAAAITSCLVLPASVTIVCGESRPASAAKSAGELRHRRREQHDVGVGELGVQSASSVTARSTMPSVERSVEIRAAAADADDRAHAPGGLERQRERAADEPDADDDERCDRGAASAVTAGAERAASAGKRRGQRVEEAAVFRGQPDRDAQELRQPVVRDRAHDHALLQQPPVDARGVADRDQQEVARATARTSARARARPPRAAASPRD